MTEGNPRGTRMQPHRLHESRQERQQGKEVKARGYRRAELPRPGVDGGVHTRIVS